MFTRIRVPEEVLSDQGSQFMSQVLKEVSRLLSVKQLVSTPYHPMCNGLVERFNGTLESMLKRMCSERPKDWDRYLPALLFTYREAPKEGLNFSPCELIYGRTVRGPMAILRDLWTKKKRRPKLRQLTSTS
jgi:transposase InsO family protein